MHLAAARQGLHGAGMICPLDRPDGTGIAHLHREGAGPTILFLSGYMSDMLGSKAVALDAWAEARGRSLLRFDYGGCGASDGRFEDQTLIDWRNDVVRAIDAVDGRVVLVGSSMGGWLMLLAALARPEQVAGLVGIAAAPDFTDWSFDPDRRARLHRDGRIEEPGGYDAPFILTLPFWESGQASLLLGQPIDLDCPVRLLHGLADEVVPWDVAIRLGAALRSADVQTILVKDGDHRLSRPQDLTLLTATLDQMMD